MYLSSPYLVHALFKDNSDQRVGGNKKQEYSVFLKPHHMGPRNLEKTHYDISRIHY